MRINRIELSWFRGASEKGTLDVDSKSIVVYGPNGSGKSTFSDAIEYIACNGKIGHLAHEYSGRKQEHGAPNTHKPDDRDSTISIDFDDGSSIKAEIASDGRCSITGEPEDVVNAVQRWEIERFILRQDKVSRFIHDPKGKKYSVLLPLLGMESLEHVTENLHKLQQKLSKEAISPKSVELNLLTKEMEPYLSDISIGGVQKVLNNLAKEYLEGKVSKEFQEIMEKVEDSIKTKIKSLTPENRRYHLLIEVLEEDLLKKLSDLDKAMSNVEGKIDAILDSRIAVLEKALEFSKALDIEQKEIECPACGQLIIAKEFAKHVQQELKSLEEVRSARDELKNSRKELASSLQNVRRNVIKKEISSWLDLPEQNDFKSSLNRLNEIDLRKLEAEGSREDIKIINDIIPSVISTIKSATKEAPPQIEKLVDDQKIVEASAKALKIIAINNEIEDIQNFLQLLVECESAVRGEIRHRTEIIMGKLSVDIQSLWSKLHPDELIGGVKLYLPEDTDKAIDVGLKFFGVEQPSPRLTLSEGHRNSLGLCIFMALARLEGCKDRPVFLDDIISSFDREHRGMLVDVLLEDFADSQIILFTHDREWFNELRFRLPPANWKFKVLKPWEGPKIGFQWSESEYTFDDARALVGLNPEAAGNRVRSIMDTNLSIIAEHLRIPIPYLRGDRNDRRTCVDFLQRIMSHAKTGLSKKNNGSWGAYSEPKEDWKEALNLLIPWANRATHTGSLTGDEVNRLIEVCEKALDHFKCSNCNLYIWTADQSEERILQCECGVMRWGY